ncbi:ABC transporter ATP-binding protein [Falsihalocynthiibacter sp. SS001]|uniref:ABC transporter ATP-binding protein n=1 Tax=Falsihalocynthiibacter sp. SS001 TaxID=3349698 RepID=UPI0036D3C793
MTLNIQGSGVLEGKSLFSGLDVALPRGEWTCLLGPSGVGKSSVLRLLAGLETPLVFHGDSPKLEGQVAFMAQSDLLFPWLTVLENTMLGVRLRGESKDERCALALLERVGLGAHTSKKPAALSGGQRQRVALARTLMEGREIVLLDEPFSALDAQTRTEMQDIAAEMLAGKTVLLVTHDPAEAARLGDNIHVMLREGSVKVAAPSSLAPRAFDNAEVLACQAKIRAELFS